MAVLLQSLDHTEGRGPTAEPPKRRNPAQEFGYGQPSDWVMGKDGEWHDTYSGMPYSFPDIPLDVDKWHADRKDHRTYDDISRARHQVSPNAVSGRNQLRDIYPYGTPRPSTMTLDPHGRIQHQAPQPQPPPPTPPLDPRPELSRVKNNAELERMRGVADKNNQRLDTTQQVLQDGGEYDWRWSAINALIDLFRNQPPEQP
jgi:hypothetical protein